jgi:hypothetical protein
MEKLIDGRWVFQKRQVTTFEVGQGPDWTKMLGARTTNFRFRSIQSDQGGAYDWYTAWARGGTQ